MTGPEVTAAVERLAEKMFRDYDSEYSTDGMAVADFYDTARADLALGLDVPQMAAAIVDHLLTDTLEGDSETLVCACGHVLVTGDLDDDRDPQAEHATHHAALIRAALIGECS